MHNDCIRFGQFPRAGGWFEQDDHEMLCMKIANQVYEVYNKEKWTPEDKDLVMWVEEEDED